MTDLPDVARRAGDLFDSGLNCTESLLVAFAERSHIECPVFPRIATGFCAGMSMTCGTCGAVSGGVLAIGLEIGRDSANDSNENCYAAVQRFKEAFEARFGSDNCRELIGCDFRTQAGRDAFEELNLHPQCRQYVEVAAALALESIGE
jgi:C_GCAxxG_C_C family probable redox protein